MIRVIIESPYAGNVEENLKYARLCVRDSLSRNEAPIASHLLYTRVLDDNIPEERQWGIDAGLTWKNVAEKHIFTLTMVIVKECYMLKNMRLKIIYQLKKEKF